MSIQLLPKLFSSFQQFVSGDQGPHWVTAWASRELNMMELFFNNITHCVETVAQGDVTSSSLYSPIEEVQARLQFLSSVFSCELSQQDFSKYIVYTVHLMWCCVGLAWKKMPSSCPGQLHFPIGQVTFYSHLFDEQGLGGLPLKSKQNM